MEYQPVDENEGYGSEMIKLNLNMKLLTKMKGKDSKTTILPNLQGKRPQLRNQTARRLAK